MKELLKKLFLLDFMKENGALRFYTRLEKDNLILDDDIREMFVRILPREIKEIKLYQLFSFMYDEYLFQLFFMTVCLFIVNYYFVIFWGWPSLIVIIVPGLYMFSCIFAAIIITLKYKLYVKRRLVSIYNKYSK